MLLIRRRAGESILIGEEIEIQILEVAPNRVKIGIVAPPSVPVMRKEAHLTRQQNQAAACTPDTDALAQLVKKLTVFSLEKAKKQDENNPKIT